MLVYWCLIPDLEEGIYKYIPPPRYTFKFIQLLYLNKHFSLDFPISQITIVL